MAMLGPAARESSAESQRFHVAPFRAETLRPSHKEITS